MLDLDGWCSVMMEAMGDSWVILMMMDAEIWPWKMIIMVKVDDWSWTTTDDGGSSLTMDYSWWCGWWWMLNHVEGWSWNGFMMFMVDDRWCTLLDEDGCRNWGPSEIRQCISCNFSKNRIFRTLTAYLVRERRFRTSFSHGFLWDCSYPRSWKNWNKSASALTFLF